MSWNKKEPRERKISRGFAYPLRDARRGGALPRPAECNCEFVCTDAKRYAPVGADASVRPAGRTQKNERTNAKTHTVCRGRCLHRPAHRTPVFTIRRGKPAIAHRADRVVRPYRTLCLFAENACNFVIACRRVDVGIDPYRDFTGSPFVVRFCRCAPRGRGRTPPLRKIITSSLFTITSYLSCPAPTLRRNVATAQNVQPFSSSVSLRLPPSPHGEGSWHCESTGNFKSLL